MFLLILIFLQKIFVRLYFELPEVFGYETIILVCMVRRLEMNTAYFGVTTMRLLSNMEKMEQR
jgi:hypothetical protein